MATVAQEIIDELGKLDEENQRRVLEFARQLTQPQISPSEWLKQAEQLQAELRKNHGNRAIDIQTLIDETREERLHGLMGSH